jgi:hypothetical protein
MKISIIGITISLCKCCLQIDNLHKLIFVNKNWPTYLFVHFLNHVDLVSACEAKFDLINDLEVEFENKAECEEFPKVADINYLLMGPSMIKYAKKVVVKKKKIKNSLFSTLTLKKILKT